MDEIEERRKANAERVAEIDRLADKKMKNGVFLPAEERQRAGGYKWKPCTCGKSGKPVFTDKHGKMWCGFCDGYIPPWTDFD